MFVRDVLNLFIKYAERKAFNHLLTLTRGAPLVSVITQVTALVLGVIQVVFFKKGFSKDNNWNIINRTFY